MDNQIKPSGDNVHVPDADLESNHGSEREETPSEESPLLPRDLPDDGEPSKAFQRRALLMGLIALLLVEIATFIMSPPIKKILEDIICQRYYPDHDLKSPQLEDYRCKDTSVQKTLAMVQGWNQAFEMGVPILTQFPYGIVADKYGRRLVLFLSVLGCFLQTFWIMMVLFFPNIFSVWAVLAGSVFFLIGGGSTMAVAMVYTIVADVVPVSERTDMYFRLVAIVLIFNVIFNPISAWLLQFDPWVSMWIGFAIMGIGTLSILLIPETMHLRRKDDKRHQEEHENDEAQDQEFSLSKHAILRQAWFSIQNDMQHVWRFIFASKSIMLLMLAMALLYPVRIAMAGVLLQYMAKRFDWSWSKATYVSTIGVIATVVCYIVILPVASKYLDQTPRFKGRPVARDLLLARIASTVMIVGCFLMAIAGAPWLFIISLIAVNIGNSFVALSRALVTAVVEPHTVATLNTTIALTEVIMGLTAPAMSWFLARGIELGGSWIGLPFLVATILALGTATMMFVLRLPEGVAQAHGG
ncbi:hypothetical protein NW762_006284 [Fusarium torreyae]|uniref:Major facilitator superfamily (MFS) profile domain-containing protein n=1 Tax=Fusarium torreyae TaxID=1237075 RepID=A0A9W8VHG0_9HYPO|nr:hypothetical protein NW762_006284 [Fusarium torreyae]